MSTTEVQDPNATPDATANHIALTLEAVAGPAPDRASYGSYAAFSDPDGNRWLLQEITVRLPGRVDGES